MQIHPKIIDLLQRRGITTEKDIKEYFSATPKRTHDPFLMKNMEDAVMLILKTIKDGGKICIYGDYDVDGVTSTAVLTEVLSHLTDKLSYHIPSRFHEGYGLNMGAVKDIADSGVSLMITVDTGTVSIDEVNYARELGMDVIVTDHHTVPENYVDGILLNPKQPGCAYPFKGLCGCGVAFKLSQAIVSRSDAPRSVLTAILDLVAIGTVSDIVPLKDENRTLVKYGLRVIQTGKRESLKYLLGEARVNRTRIQSEDISFIIGPHINAAGRIRHARIAEELFLTNDKEIMAERASELAECNAIRKEEQQEVFDQAMRVISERLSGDDFLVIDLEEANEGVTGIAAGKIKELVYKPTVIVTPMGNGLMKGTGRSIDGVNLYDLLATQREMYVSFGGHAAACGFTLKAEYLDAFRRNLNMQTRAIRAEHPDLFVKKIQPDMVLDPADVTLDFVHQFDLLEPCGCENERPTTAVRASIEHVSHMGDRGQYLRFQAVMDGFVKLSCIAFHDVKRLERNIQATAGQPATIVGNLRDDIWRGNHQLKMMVEDIHPQI